VLNDDLVMTDNVDQILQHKIHINIQKTVHSYEDIIVLRCIIFFFL